MLVICLAFSAGAGETQCQAITLKGTQCKHKAKIEGLCKQHYKKKHGIKPTIKNQCKGITRKGAQCNNKACDGMNYCHVHKNKHNFFTKARATTIKRH